MALVSWDGPAAQHGALFPLEPESCVRSNPHLHVVPPCRHKAHSVLRPGVDAKARCMEKDLKSHFVKHPCSRRPSHEALTTDFPFAHTPPRSRGLCHSQPLFSPRWEPQGVRIHADRAWQPTWLLASSLGAVAPCGQPSQPGAIAERFHSSCWGPVGREVPR